MLFNSLEFFIFLPLVVLAHYLLPARARWAALIIASYVFYASGTLWHAALLALSSLCAWGTGLALGRSASPGVRRAWLGAALVFNLGLLGFFKYADFLLRALADLGAAAPRPPLDIALPIGISFFTFQSLSYTFDVYLGRLPSERRLDRVALYLAFFPQLIAGPIERAQRLLPQLCGAPRFDYALVREGLLLILWGLVKKCVIADRLAQVVDYVYASPGQHTGPVLVLATIFFAFQIYADFSGYCDIALGTARVLGIRLSDNFQRPYFAASIPDFWRRWHISLSTWFRDYVYVPLGGNRVSAWQARANLFVVFLLSGLWHGANWTFLAWGALHGTYMIAARALAARCTPTPHGLARHALGVATTFLLVTVAWVFFRSASLGDALSVFQQLPRGWGAFAAALPAADPMRVFGVPWQHLALGVLGIALLTSVEAASARRPLRAWLCEQPTPVRWLIYSAALWLLFLFGVFQQKEFIYFQF